MYEYINNNNLWYWQNPKVNGNLLPNWDNKGEFIFFPVRTDKGEYNYMDTLLEILILQYVQLF